MPMQMTAVLRLCVSGGLKELMFTLKYYSNWQRDRSTAAGVDGRGTVRGLDLDDPR
jgi:hypothetical protein